MVPYQQHAITQTGITMSETKVVDFQARRQNKQRETELDASVSRHPAGKMKPATEPVKQNTETRELIHLSLQDAIAPGMAMTNIEEIEYRLQRLDAVLEHSVTFMSDTDAARLVKHIKEAIHSTAEVSYFEGLAEGYTADDNDLE